MRALAVLLILVSTAGVAAGANTYTVLPDGSGDFATIQAAVAAAVSGDEIVLGDGTFEGDGNRAIDYQGKSITIRSMSGAASACVIAVDGCTGFLFTHGEDAGAILDGVTISGAGASGTCSPVHGAVVCTNSSPLVRNVRISAGQGGVHITGGAPRLENVTVQDNEAPGILALASTPTLVGCVLESNTYSGSGPGGPTSALILDTCETTLSNCHIQGNAGGISAYSGTLDADGCVIAHNGGDAGVVLDAISANLERCTITRNVGNWSGGILLQSGDLHLNHTIVWGNCGYDSDDILVWWGTLATECSDVREAGVVLWGGTRVTGPGMLDHEPEFCDPKDCSAYYTIEGWYAVDDDSPLITAACGPMGASSAECKVSVEPTTWGKVKALYR